MTTEVAQIAGERNPHKGSSLDDFLRADGIYEEVTAEAIKRVIAWKLDQELED